MKLINIYEAKAHLSQFIRRVKNGEVLLLCERNVPVAEIRPISKPFRFKSSQIGNAAEEVVFISKHFNDSLEKKDLARFQDSPL